jgi:hypothetical protein
MDGIEVVRLLDERREDGHHFIKWWRKENDFVDIELIDSFRATVKAGDIFGGFELLDMEQLWAIVADLCPGRVSRRAFDGHESIVWDRLDKKGVARSIRCSFAPEFLIQVFDVETKGNYIA